jgi:hypothetical protein
LVRRGPSPAPARLTSPESEGFLTRTQGSTDRGVACGGRWHLVKPSSSPRLHRGPYRRPGGPDGPSRADAGPGCDRRPWPAPRHLRGCHAGCRLTGSDLGDRDRAGARHRRRLRGVDHRLAGVHHGGYAPPTAPAKADVRDKQFVGSRPARRPPTVALIRRPAMELRTILVRFKRHAEWRERLFQLGCLSPNHGRCLGISRRSRVVQLLWRRCER